jgi:DNA (cytosine-5)-methyltransferase 1
MAAYYNEFDPYAAQWLRNLIAKGLIADGEVDERSIVDVPPADLRSFTQCHFFAGIGGWSYAARLAGWPDDRPVWTGSCPCQPFSVAGKQLGTDDPRHLWPHFFRLIAARRPTVVMGEQVAGAAGYGWFDGVAADLEAEGYASRAVDVPACAIDAPHIRSRLYWVASDMADAACGRNAGQDESSRFLSGSFQCGSRHGGNRLDDADDARLEGHTGHGGDGRGRAGAAGSATATGCRDMADANSTAFERRWRELSKAKGTQADGGDHRPWRNGSFWSDAVWLTGADGKARRAQPGLPLLAHGIPARVGRLRAYGNAIVPQLAAEMIAAFMDATDA